MTNVSTANEFGQLESQPFRISTASIFAIVCLTLGMIAAAGYAIGTVPDTGVRHPQIYPLDWMFWAIWFVLYPTMGVAGYHLWRSRSLAEGKLAWKLFLLGYAANLTWVPVVHLTHSPVVAPAAMDAVTGAAFLPGAWVIATTNRSSFLWLLPLLIWGLVTGILKIWQLEINRDLFTPAIWSLLQWAAYTGGIGLLIQSAILFRGFRNLAIVSTATVQARINAVASDALPTNESARLAIGQTEQNKATLREFVRVV